MWFPAWGCLGNGYSCFWEADRLLVLSQLLDANVFLSSSEARAGGGAQTNKQEHPSLPFLPAWSCSCFSTKPQSNSTVRAAICTAALSVPSSLSPASCFHSANFQRLPGLMVLPTS